MQRCYSCVLLLLLLAGWILFINQLGQHVIFEPSRKLQPQWVNAQEVNFPVEKGVQLNAFYSPAAKNQSTILFFHGNSYNITFRQELIRQLSEYGYGVLVFDYRGFGKSKGTPSQARMYQDGQAALDFLLQHKKIPPQKLVLWGNALGAAVALHTANANDLPFQALILQGPLTNTPELGLYFIIGHYRPHNLFQKFARLMMLPPLANKRFDSRTEIGNVRVPLLIGYSMQDKVVPWRMSRELASQAPKGTTVQPSANGVHSDFAWFVPFAVKYLRSLPEPAPNANVVK